MTPLPLAAPVWRRLAALLYDSLILIALSFLYGALATGAAVIVRVPYGEFQPMFHGFLFPLGWLATLVAFYCWFWRKSGQTIGMKTWKIRLVPATPSGQDSDSTLRWRQCLVRALVAAPCVLCLGVGYWYCLFNANRDSLQDRLAGTRVLFAADL